jgi:sigma-B regulation protein RsbU (phosphoserine phosphatase)
MTFPTRTEPISYQAIIDALHKGQNKRAARLLQDHVEACLQRVKKWGIESGYLDRDLEIAKDIQKASFPQRSPAIPGLSCSIFYKPARSVGGDYYDFLSLEDGTWGIAIGDVSGKGIGAALILATLQASLRAQTLRPRSQIETLVSNVNRLVSESSPAEFFASLFYAEYRPAEGVLHYVNAGHNPPLVVRRSYSGNKVLTLQSGGAPVGALADSRYSSMTIQLVPGDVLVAYTDGITEAENSQGESFGQQRLEKILCDSSAREPQEIQNNILDELSAYSVGCPQTDDITLVVMQVEGTRGTSQGDSTSPREKFRRIRPTGADTDTIPYPSRDVMTAS